MTTFGAYDAGLPCKNTSCKSHGIPHPNCKCYGGMAKGGVVDHFCSSDRAHNSDCKYYADGGEVAGEMPQHEDPAISIASYLGHQGLHGLLKMGQNSSDQSIEKYNQDIHKGHKKLNSKVKVLFSGDLPEKTDYSKARKFVDEWVDRGGITADIKQEMSEQHNPKQFAEGGSVKKDSNPLADHHIANAYPDHNVLLQAAKGRMSNYLNGLKPQKNAPKLTFDHEPDTRAQEKSYNRALNMAVDPLHVIDKIKEGTIEPEHIKHFKNLYPEVDAALQKKIAERITQSQLKKEPKPPHHIRQGLSMFLGTPLSGELTPQNIQASQATFMLKKPDQGEAQPVTKNKKNTSTLTKADDSFLTSNQARVAREQKQS